MKRKAGLSALLVAVLAAGLFRPKAYAAEAVVTTIAVEHWPQGVAVNDATNRIFVANEGSDSLSVIDGRTNTVVDTVPVGSHPLAVGVNPTTNRVYVANYNADSLSVIEGATNTVMATVAVGRYPYGVGVNGATNRIYVANQASNSVSVVDGITHTVLDTVAVGTAPYGVGVNPATNRIYVANLVSNSVSVIDGITHTVLSTIGVGTHPYGVGVNPTTNRVYVANHDSGSVSVIDGIANRVVATVSVGITPHGVGVNPATDRVYVSNTQSDTLSVIDGVSSSVVAAVAVGNTPYGVAVNPVTNRVYVANLLHDNVSVIADSPPTQGLKIQYQAGNSATMTSLVMPFFKILNMSDLPVPLSELTARYWYTWDSHQPQTDHCIWAMGNWSGCLALTKTFVRVLPPRVNADYYVEFGFTRGAGELAAHGSTQAVINWFYKQDWSAYNQRNDYSFNALASTYVDNPQMTLYRNGAPIWGTEPGPLPVWQPTATRTPSLAPTFIPKP
jgi:YVTN family beta-propeller protein